MAEDIESAEDLTIRLLQRAELPRILPLIRELNPAIPELVLLQRLEEMTQGGYQCVAALWKDDCIGVAGLWTGTRFWCGRYLDVDNVVVDPRYRSMGVGQRLTDWIERYAREQACEVLVLDAYVTNQRAHAFYERNGFRIVGYHFVKHLRPIRQRPADDGTGQGSTGGGASS
ncbi:GNAT family N-acetyltransferase [Acidithiobacillus sp.]|uniref:GNAT family N-acetyltransferase n=1 Tax=Acidithiobacillus sp. TaxID=1872118 RepID=UPI0023238A94|nr:GNAT family N-acetyltransferase [Acidithiobacillus sp.]MDA8176885.1 GNAT family N-acetyltransferase [Acidithiobacillus sp.]